MDSELPGVPVPNRVATKTGRHRCAVWLQITSLDSSFLTETVVLQGLAALPPPFCEIERPGSLLGWVNVPRRASEKIHGQGGRSVQQQKPAFGRQTESSTEGASGDSIQFSGWVNSVQKRCLPPELWDHLCGFEAIGIYLG